MSSFSCFQNTISKTASKFEEFLFKFGRILLVKQVCRVLTGVRKSARKLSIFIWWIHDNPVLRRVSIRNIGVLDSFDYFGADTLRETRFVNLFETKTDTKESRKANCFWSSLGGYSPWNKFVVCLRVSVSLLKNINIRMNWIHDNPVSRSIHQK